MAGSCRVPARRGVAGAPRVIFRRRSPFAVSISQAAEGQPLIPGCRSPTKIQSAPAGAEDRGQQASVGVRKSGPTPIMPR
jgi:hypothetical protein